MRVSPPERVVFLSAYHDYRTKKRASVHPLAAAMVRLGYDVSFISTRFSRLSKRTGDSRLFLWDRANRIEIVDGVRCYLWRTELHPFASSNALLNRVMGWLFPLYARLTDTTVDALFRQADYVVLEASVAAILVRRIHALNPRCRIIYYATDRLDTVGAHPYVRARIEKDADLISHCALRSPRMASDFAWAKGRLYRAEFGIDTDAFADIGSSPYRAPRNAVAVGSMLFDARFFAEVPSHFPEVEFHVIGCGTTFDAPRNVHIHGEMSFCDTLPYVKHAQVGIAPYRPAPGVEYLADSSLKLAQYEYFGLPAVCPDFAAGENPARFGYAPASGEAMRDAFASALMASGSIVPRTFLSWEEVARRVLRPHDFPDNALK